MEAVNQQMPEVIVQEAVALANTGVCDIINIQSSLLMQINEKRVAEQLTNSTGTSTFPTIDAGIYQVADKMSRVVEVKAD